MSQVAASALCPRALQNSKFLSGRARSVNFGCLPDRACCFCDRNLTLCGGCGARWMVRGGQAEKIEIMVHGPDLDGSIRVGTRRVRPSHVTQVCYENSRSTTARNPYHCSDDWRQNRQFAKLVYIIGLNISCKTPQHYHVVLRAPAVSMSRQSADGRLLRSCGSAMVRGSPSSKQQLPGDGSSPG